MTQGLSVAVFLLAVFIVGCATTDHAQDRSTYYEAAYNDRNRAPASMTPPEKIESTQSLDPLNVQTQADYYFSMAEAQSYEGNHQKAIESLKMVQVYDQKSAHVPLRLSAEYLKLGMFSQAIEQAELAVQRNPKLIDGYLLLGGLYSSMKTYDKALQQYQTVLKIEPNNTEAPLYIGAVYAEKKENDKAVKYFESLARNEDYASPHVAHYYIGRIRSEQEGPQYQRAAEQAFQKSLSLKPTYTESILALGSLYMKNKQETKAIQLLSSYQREHGPNSRVAEVLSQYYLEEEKYDLAFEQFEILENTSDEPLNIKVKMALILIEQKKYRPAIAKLNEVLVQVPDSDKIRFYLAAVYEEVGDMEKAVEHFQRVPTESQFYGEALVHSAYILKQQKKIDEALKHVKNGLQQRQDIPQLYAVYASLLDEKRQYSEANEILKSAVEKFPDHVQLRFFLGTIQDRLGDKRSVISHMKKVIELDPNHVQGLNYLAFTYSEMDEHLDEAEKLVKRALELEPRDGYILDTLGWILFKRGNTMEAIKVLETAQKAQPTESVIADHLGDAYLKHQMVDRARAMYEKAIQLEADEKKIDELRMKLTKIDKQQVKGHLRVPASVPAQSEP